MNKVIDSGTLSKNELVAFLADDKNIPVVTDMMAMEALRHRGLVGDELAFFRTGFRKLADESKRAIVLKPTWELTPTIPVVGSSATYLVSQHRTREFPTFCDHVMGKTNPVTTQHIESEQMRSRQFFERVGANVEPFRSDLLRKTRLIPENVLSNLRADKPLGDEYYEVCLGMILGETRNALEHQFPNNPTIAPQPALILDWIRFRYSAAMQALLIWWAKHGGLETVVGDKLRNDAIDLFYVAFGTYFDGVLTRDAKMNEISNRTNDILKRSFGVGPN